MGSAGRFRLSSIMPCIRIGTTAGRPGRQRQQGVGVRQGERSGQRGMGSSRYPAAGEGMPYAWAVATRGAPNPCAQGRPANLSAPGIGGQAGGALPGLLQLAKRGWHQLVRQPHGQGLQPPLLGWRQAVSPGLPLLPLPLLAAPLLLQALQPAGLLEPLAWAAPRVAVRARGLLSPPPAWARCRPCCLGLPVFPNPLITGVGVAGSCLRDPTGRATFFKTRSCLPAALLGQANADGAVASPNVSACCWRPGDGCPHASRVSGGRSTMSLGAVPPKSRPTPASPGCLLVCLCNWRPPPAAW